MKEKEIKEGIVGSFRSFTNPCFPLVSWFLLDF
jgi:hypothetical protein